jgi:hypothetical protein
MSGDPWLNGWYSKKAEKRYGSCICQTKDNHTVAITNRTEDNGDGYLWEDKVYVGKVRNCRNFPPDPDEKYTRF